MGTDMTSTSMHRPQIADMGFPRPVTPSGDDDRHGSGDRTTDTRARGIDRDGPLSDTCRLDDTGAYRRSIENFIGTVKVPVGLAGPLMVRGMFADGEYALL